MAQGGVMNAANASQQSQQPAQQPAQQPSGGFGFGPNQFGPQMPQQSANPQQPNAPVLGGSSYGFGPQQFGPQQQNPFGMTGTTFAAQQTPFAAAPAQQPNLSTAINQIKGGNQFDAQNTMRQIVGLPPLAAPAYNPNPTMSDVTSLLRSGDQASAKAMMQQMVGLGQPSTPAAAPPPQTYMNVAPPAAAPAPAASGNVYTTPSRIFGRRR